MQGWKKALALAGLAAAAGACGRSGELVAPEGAGFEMKQSPPTTEPATHNTAPADSSGGRWGGMIGGG
jgi:hypothetical protein